MTFWRRINPSYPNPDEVRMTLGEHLEELRSRMIRAIIALVIGATICFIYSSELLGFLCAPIFAILQEQGLPLELAYFNPTETFMISMKVAIIVGIILTAPFSIMQIWGFIAAGLYPRERKWVRRFAPASIILFFVGAAFLQLIVSPVLYRFLLGYQNELPNMTAWVPNFHMGTGRAPMKVNLEDEGWPTPAGASGPAATRPSTAGPVQIEAPWASSTRVPALLHDPENPPEGIPWLNRTEHRIHIRFGNQTYFLSNGALAPVTQGPRLRPDIRVSENIIFMLQLSAVFGIAFQVPVVVAFLAAIGFAPVAKMASLRRYVWFIMAIVAAIITPTTDPFGMLLLLLPMVLLYEVGLWVARIIEKSKPAATTG